MKFHTEKFLDKICEIIKSDLREPGDWDTAFTINGASGNSVAARIHSLYLRGGHSASELFIELNKTLTSMKDVVRVMTK